MRVVMSAICTSGEPLSVSCVRLSSMTLVFASFVSIPLSGGRHASRCLSSYSQECTIEQASAQRRVMYVMFPALHVAAGPRGRLARAGGVVRLLHPFPSVLNAAVTVALACVAARGWPGLGAVATLAAAM